ncbi:MAG: flagellar hook-associated protein FlgK [bacterium]|nr:flagellar hook-associated protein FlgK [bacterium]
MMNLFSAIELGKNSLLTQQQVFSIIGHNMANVNTPGYSRQVVDLENVRPSVIGLKDGGRGVNLIGIRSIRDQFVNSQIMERRGIEGKFGELTGIMQTVETLFDEAHGLGLSDQLTNFFNAWNDVANNPTDIPTRNSLVSKSQIMANSMQNTFLRLTDQQEIYNDNIGVMVDEVNTIANEIAELNEKIAYSEGSNVPANDLLDQRERRLRDLSELIGTNVYYDQSNNSATVEVAGRPLVSFNIVNDLSVQRSIYNSNYYDVYMDQYGVPAFDITTQVDGGKMSANLLARDGEVVNGLGTISAVASAGGLTTLTFSQPHGLSVGDLVTVNGETRSVNHIGADDSIVVADFTTIPAVGDAWQERDGYIPEYKNDLNKLATGLIYNVNDQHQQGYGLGDSGATPPGRLFFQETSSTVIGRTASVNAAGDTVTFDADVSTTLSVGDVITINGETRVITSYNSALFEATVNTPFTLGLPVPAGTTFEYAGVQTNATLLQVNSAIVTDSSLIAASDSATDDGAGNPLAVGNNVNALSIAQLLDNNSTVDSDNDGTIDTGSFHEFLTSLHSKVGNEGSTAINEADSNGAMLNFLENRRDSVSAVSLDEEAANLMQFEKSYQALAQFMGKMSQLTDVLINIV